MDTDAVVRGPPHESTVNVRYASILFSSSHGRCGRLASLGLPLSSLPSVLLFGQAYLTKGDCCSFRYIYIVPCCYDNATFSTDRPIRRRTFTSFRPAHPYRMYYCTDYIACTVGTRQNSALLGNISSVMHADRCSHFRSAIVAPSRAAYDTLLVAAASMQVVAQITV